jgi:hypothetical protein
LKVNIIILQIILGIWATPVTWVAPLLTG